MIDREKYLEQQRRYNRSERGYQRARKYEDSERGAAMRTGYETFARWAVRRQRSKHPHEPLLVSSRRTLELTRMRSGLIRGAAA
jgi:hypothetical protein